MSIIRTGVVLLKPHSNARDLNMGSLITIFVKSSSYKDGDVENQLKFEYLYNDFRHSANARKYDLTCYLGLFWPVMKAKYINNCKAVFNLNILDRFWSVKEYGAWGMICFYFCFCWSYFSHEKNQQHTHYSQLKYLPPPRIHHDITYCHNYIGYEVEEADQDKDQGGVYCKGKGRIYGGEHNGGKNQ